MLRFKRRNAKFYVCYFISVVVDDVDVDVDVNVVVAITSQSLNAIPVIEARKSLTNINVDV